LRIERRNAHDQLDASNSGFVSSAALPPNRTVLLNKPYIREACHHHHSRSVITSDGRNAYAFPRRLDSAVTARSWFSRCRSAQAPLRLIPGQVLLAFPCVHCTLFRHVTLSHSSLALPPKPRCSCSRRAGLSVWFGVFSPPTRFPSRPPVPESLTHTSSHTHITRMHTYHTLSYSVAHTQTLFPSRSLVLSYTSVSRPTLDIMLLVYRLRRTLV
jgi:hypothetical protein